MILSHTLTNGGRNQATSIGDPLDTPRQRRERERKEGREGGRERES
jgi:hypothetical protein